LALEQLTSGKADFFITIAEQADLSKTDKLQTKEEKGQYVFETMVATADRTQADLLAYLYNQGVEYESFYIVNKILVKAGTLDLVMAIADRSDVSAIDANHGYQLEKPINPKMSTSQPQNIEPNISFVKADQVWALGYTGQGTVIAGNDTGLYWNHPALIRQYRGCLNPPDCTDINHNYNWWDAIGTYPTVPDDGHGHGTHTYGTMVGDDGGSNQIGMAPRARLVHFQKGWGDWCRRVKILYPG
jgi:subtilisin family serine protease